MNSGATGPSRRCKAEGVATVQGEFNVFISFH